MFTTVSPPTPRLPLEGAKGLLIIRTTLPPISYLPMFATFQLANVSAPSRGSWLQTSFRLQTEGGPGMPHSADEGRKTPRQH